MTDLISRQAAIEALSMNMPELTTPDGCGQFDHEIQIADEAFVDCMRIINDLPSVEFVQHGKWEPCCEWHGANGEIETRAYSCSECAVIIPVDIQDVRFSRGCFLRYCPNCGARMDK